LDDAHIGKIAKLLFEHRPRVEIVELFRPAGPVLQLLGRVALDDQKSAGFERAPHAAPFYRALCGRAELRENFDDDVERGLRAIPGVDMGLDKAHLHAALGGERAGFVLRRRRKIERDDVETLLREPNAVAAFAVRDRKRPAARRQQLPAGFEKIIRLLAERIVGARKASLPARTFACLVVYRYWLREIAKNAVSLKPCARSAATPEREARRKRR